MLLYCWKFEETGCRWRRVTDPSLHTNTVTIVLPVMERATNCVALHITDREVRTEVGTIRTQHLNGSAIATKDNHTSIEKIDANGLSAPNRARYTQRKP